MGISPGIIAAEHEAALGAIEQVQPTRLQVLGNFALKHMNAITTSACVGAIAIGNMGGDSAEARHHPSQSEATGTEVALVGKPSEVTSAISSTADVPYIGNRAWVTDRRSGYYIGGAFKGEKIDKAVLSTPSKKSVLGLITSSTTGVEHCGYVDGTLVDDNPFDATGFQDPLNPCRPYASLFKDRSTFAKGVNCGEGVCDDGVKVKLTRLCSRKAWYNLAPASKGPLNMNYPEAGSGPYDPAKKERGKYVYYRLTVPDPDSKGLRYAVVRSEQNGWVLMRTSCVLRKKGVYPQGGPKLKKS